MKKQKIKNAMLQSFDCRRGHSCRHCVI